MRNVQSGLLSRRSCSAFFAALLGCVGPLAGAGPFPVVQPNADLQRAVEISRQRFLSSQSFDRMHVAVLVRQPDGSWHQGSVEGDVLAYPASCVKLPFLIAAVHRCSELGEAPDCLDA